MPKPLTMKRLERGILTEARQAFANPKLKRKHIKMWSNGRGDVANDLPATEAMAELPGTGLWVAIAKKHDRRWIGRC